MRRSVLAFALLPALVGCELDMTGTGGNGIVFPCGSFSLPCGPVGPSGFTIDSLADLTIQQGQAGQRHVNITRTGGFTGAVNFVVSSGNPDLTATVSPTSTTDETVVVTATASLSLQPGVHMVTVTGSATGNPDVMKFMDVNVTAAPQSGYVTLNFARPGDVPDAG